MKSKRILVVLVATVMVFSLISCNLGLALYINAKAGESYNIMLKPSKQWM